MKKFLAAAFAAVALLTAGCEAESLADKAAQTATGTDLTVRERAFVKTVRSTTSLTAEDAGVVVLGKSVCTSLDSNAAPEKVLDVARNEGLSNKESAAFLTASVVTFCPEHKATVQQYVNDMKAEVV